MERRVIFSPEAAVDLLRLYEYILGQSGPRTAIGYIARLEAHCAGFKFSAERGTKRDDLRPGLRIAGFERRVTIVFHVEPTTVVIDRIMYGGRNIDRAVRNRRGVVRRQRK